MVLSRLPVTIRLVTVLLAGLTANPAFALETVTTPQDYTAVHKVLRNGKELAAVTIQLSHQKDVWKLHGFTHDTRGSRGTVPLQMTEDAIDPLSLSLNLRSELVKNETEMSAHVVEEDKIKGHVYKVAGVETTDTALGCINTTRLQRLRNNPNRISQGWYARNYNFILVRMQHKSNRGNNLELQITALEIEDKTIKTVAPC